MSFLAIDSADIKTTVEGILNSKGIKYNLSGSLKSTAKHSFSFRLINEVARIGNDDVSFVLRVNNGNDGKTAFGFQLGLFRAVCLNGLQIGVGENVRLIHRDCNRTLSFLQTIDDLVEQTMEQRQAIIETVEELQSMKLEESKAISIIGNLNVSDSAKRKAIYSLLGNPDALRTDLKDGTAWSLGNLMNESIRSVHGRTWTADRQNRTLFEDIQLLAAA
jgi:hypothetical protein